MSTLSRDEGDDTCAMYWKRIADHPQSIAFLSCCPGILPHFATQPNHSQVPLEKSDGHLRSPQNLTSGTHPNTALRQTLTVQPESLRKMVANLRRGAGSNGSEQGFVPGLILLAGFERGPCRLCWRKLGSAPWRMSSGMDSMSPVLHRPVETAHPRRIDNGNADCAGNFKAARLHLQC